MTTGIAIALYNGARFLQDQMETLRLQTAPADQVVLCDDGSSDHTVEVVREYIEKHGLQGKWQVHINEKNLGYAKNFYRAMELCDTDLIYLCDQDDIWKADKLEKMNGVMETHREISLLMCKGGVIDAQGNALHGMLIQEAKQTENITLVTSKQVLRVLAWTGMLMCVRREAFEKWKPYVATAAAPHDLALALCAADQGAFFEYDYVGAFHRRHENNAANEEHRLSKVLNLKTKVRDMTAFCGYMEGLANANLPLSEETAALLRKRKQAANSRLLALRQRKLGLLLKTYLSDDSGLLRFGSFVCDLWLILFGDYTTLK